MKLFVYSQIYYGAAIGIWEWMGKFTAHFTERVITYPCLN